MHGIVLLFLLLVAPMTTLAHDSGESHEVESQGYLIDIGYSTDSPVEREAVPFDFRITREGEEVPFTNVWVKIDGKEEVVFAGAIYNSEYGGPRLSYVFPGPGPYTISVRYEDGPTAIASTSFSMNVQKEGMSTTIPDLGALFLGVLLGVAGFVGGRKLFQHLRPQSFT